MNAVWKNRRGSSYFSEIFREYIPVRCRKKNCLKNSGENCEILVRQRFSTIQMKKTVGATAPEQTSRKPCATTAARRLHSMVAALVVYGDMRGQTYAPCRTRSMLLSCSSIGISSAPPNETVQNIFNKKTGEIRCNTALKTMPRKFYKKRKTHERCGELAGRCQAGAG